MHGVFDRARSEHTLRERCTRCCRPSIPRTSAPRSTCCLRSRESISRLNTQPVPSPVNASMRRPRGQLRMTRGRCGSLHLQRVRLSLITTLPVFPAHWNKIEHRMFSFHQPELARETFTQLSNHHRSDCPHQDQSWTQDPGKTDQEALSYRDRSTGLRNGQTASQASRFPPRLELLSPPSMTQAV
jgi:hypothetical protein